jgi:alkanesulfonate monooxygenase SsuD/methylene tetrahydromethanopterin reductase-like flavin-dependent oxidoreductase (luciferase family)
MNALKLEFKAQRGKDDAIVQDKTSGLFAKPEKVHRLDYRGRYFRSRGPFTVPRSAQGHPVIIQAGQSGRGKSFGAQWGEVIFVVQPNAAPRGPALLVTQDPNRSPRIIRAWRRRT